MSPSRTDRRLFALLLSSAVLATSILLLVVGFLLIQAWPAFTGIGVLRLLGDPRWSPADQAAAGEFGLMPMLIGSLLVTGGAVALAAPLGILCAIYCRHLAPPLIASAFRKMIGLLAGVPSVVFGFWGLVVLVPILAAIQMPGASLLAGILILALMILPTITLFADSALQAVPAAVNNAAVALGLSRWRQILQVALPAAAGGIKAGVVLGVARATGETLTVLMVCGNVVQVPMSLFDPVRTLTANIALEMAYAYADHRAALFASGLLLTLVVIAIMAPLDLRRSMAAHD